MPDLLIEFGCEDLPASACREAIDQVPGLTAQALADVRLPDASVAVWVVAVTVASNEVALTCALAMGAPLSASVTCPRMRPNCPAKVTAAYASSSPIP